MTRCRVTALAIVTAIAAGRVRVAAAQPLVIVDARIDTLRGVLSVGRGYALSTNTVYSSCLDNARDTEDTSYDTDFQLRSLSTPDDLGALDRDGQEFVGSALANISRAGRPLQAMVAILTVHARIRPLDESRQKLAEDMTQLLTQGRLAAFVSVCGSHYVRALRRRSSLYVLFTYESATVDTGFEHEFGAALSGFNLDTAKPPPEQASAVSADAAAHNLRIVNWAIGLGPQPGGGIAFDMATYRKMVDQAFQAAQHDRAGVPYEMEVVPWLSHPVVVAKVMQTASRSEDDLYTLRQIFTDAAEGYLELSARVATARQRAVMADLCQQQLYRTVVLDGVVRPSYETAYVRGQRSDRRRVVPVVTLVAALSPSAIAHVQQQAEVYALDLDATSQPRSSIARCLAALERNELHTRPQSIPECTQAIEPFDAAARATLSQVDDYCFPDIIRALPPTRAGG